MESSLSRLFFDEKWRELQERGYVFFIAWFTDPPVEVKSETPFKTSVDSSLVVVVIVPEMSSEYPALEG